MNRNKGQPPVKLKKQIETVLRIHKSAKLNKAIAIFFSLILAIVRIIPSQFLVVALRNFLISVSYRKQVINNNFKSTIGKKLSQSAHKTLYRKCINNIARVIVETIQFQDRYTPKVKYTNVRELEKRAKAQKGIIVLASHYGNWELACINLPKHTLLPCYGVYKPLKSEAFDQKIKSLRARYGLILTPMNSIARAIATHHKSGQPAIYILIADQNPRSIQNVAWTPFLGTMTAFSKGVVSLQNRYNLPVAYMKNTPLNKLFNYQIDFEFPDAQQSKYILEWYSESLEAQILEAPENWLWSHKRWKRKYPNKSTE